MESVGYCWLFGALLLGLALLVVVVAVRGLRGGISRSGDAAARDQPPIRSQATGILDERYARGELSTEGYERLRGLGEDT